MKRIHKIISVVILLAATSAAYLFEAKMTDVTAQSLVTFFSVVFGFYMTCIAILYSSSYTKSLHRQIDAKGLKRGTHILRRYLLISGYWSVFSITLIIIFTTFAAKSATGVFINPFLSSMLFGISALNIFYMSLLLRTIIDGMIEEAKKS